jgi:hypothetical protein
MTVTPGRSDRSSVQQTHYKILKLSGECTRKSHHVRAAVGRPVQGQLAGIGIEAEDREPGRRVLGC